MNDFKPSRSDSADTKVEETYKRTQMATGVHWTKADLNAIDAWIARQNDPTITRKVAIRRLVELGLTATPRATPAERLKNVREFASAGAGLKVKK